MKAAMRQERAKGSAARHMTTQKRSTSEAEIANIADRVKVVVVTLALWGWFPVGLADWMNRWGGSQS